MGDHQRGKVLAEYLHRNFPSQRSVLSVADGNHILAKHLNYPRIQVIDPYVRSTKPSRVYKTHKQLFLSTDLYKCDLVIGLHPDEATGEIVDYSIKNRVPCVIVPCCVKGKYANGSLYTGKSWCNYLVNLLRQRGFDVDIDILPMSGANMVIRALPYG